MNDADLKKLGDDPIALFDEWFKEASALGLKHPDAMTLATCGEGGRPSARVVLLKGVRDGDFYFFTNYDSRKGQELASNGQASLVFYWEPLEREVRVEGRAERVSRAESEEYFATRPRESQLGAWASRQSAVLSGGRDELLARYREYDELFLGKEVPCPPHWGGYRVVPGAIEFWQGQPGRLHDRYLFTREGALGAQWRAVRLAP